MEDTLRHTLVSARGSRTILSITIVFLGVGLLPRSRAGAQTSGALAKLSIAVQQTLTTSNSFVWANPTTRTVRVLIQTYGPASSDLLAAISQSGGTIVHQFTAINGVLAA